MWSDFLWLLGQRTGCRLISCTCSIERTGASRLLFGLVSFHESSKGDKRRLPQNVPRRFPHFCLLVEVRSNWNILWRDPRLIARQLLQPLAYIHISRLWKKSTTSTYSYMNLNGLSRLIELLITFLSLVRRGFIAPFLQKFFFIKALLQFFNTFQFLIIS